MRLVEAVEVRARQAVGFALLEVRPQTDVPVGEGEDRLALGQPGQVQLGLADRPWFGREGTVLLGHQSSSRSERSDTTTLAPCSRNAPAYPASTPASASSKTAASSGVTSSARAPARKVSGAGFPFSPSRSATTPSMRASKNPSMPAATRTSLVLALDETTAQRRPESRAASRYRTEPSKTSTPSSRINRKTSSFLRLPSPRTVSAPDGSPDSPSGSSMPRAVRNERTPS